MGLVEVGVEYEGWEWGDYVSEPVRGDTHTSSLGSNTRGSVDGVDSNLSINTLIVNGERE